MNRLDVIDSGAAAGDGLMHPFDCARRWKFGQLSESPI